MPKRVAIIGGGVTGLAAAYDLERRSDVTIDLYEAAPYLGGKVHTARSGPMIVERGPDCFFARKPGVMEFVRELGLETELIQPLQAEFSILYEGELHRVPRGLAAFNSISDEALDAATFLSETARTEVRAEPDQPKGVVEDESIRSFFTRRFGSEFSRVLVEPLLAGTHGGDPDRLSMMALYPGYLELERRQGSIRRSGVPTESGPTFFSFRNGMQMLVNALAASLERTTVHVDRKVDSLNNLEADRSLLAVPANRAAPLVAVRSPQAAQALNAIKHLSSAIVTFKFPRAKIGHPLDGTGFLVPPVTRSEVTGATWSSEKWAGRAPSDDVLVRVFLAARDGQQRDSELTDHALAGIRDLMMIQDAPTATWVTRWVDALPQYDLGHLERLAAIDEALKPHPDLYVAGTSYRGVGIPDCLRQGREAACRILETF